MSTAWTSPDAFERLDPEERAAVIDAIKEGKGELRLDGRAANWAGKAVAKSLELNPADKGAKEQVKDILSAAIDKGHLAVSKKGRPAKEPGVCCPGQESSLFMTLVSTAPLRCWAIRIAARRPQRLAQGRTACDHDFSLCASCASYY